MTHYQFTTNDFVYYPAAAEYGKVLKADYGSEQVCVEILTGPRTNQHLDVDSDELIAITYDYMVKYVLENKNNRVILDAGVRDTPADLPQISSAPHAILSSPSDDTYGPAHRQSLHELTDLTAKLAKAKDALRRLDASGGLGLDKHQLIADTLAALDQELPTDIAYSDTAVMHVRELIEDRVLKTLQSAFRADSGAMRALVVNRVPVTQELADHPNIIVDAMPLAGAVRYEVGLLGVVNGFLHALGCRRRVAYNFDKSPQPVFLGFVLVDDPGTSA